MTLVAFAIPTSIRSGIAALALTSMTVAAVANPWADDACYTAVELKGAEVIITKDNGKGPMTCKVGRKASESANYLECGTDTTHVLETTRDPDIVFFDGMVLRTPRADNGVCD